MNSAVLILSNGRPDNIKTLKTLDKQGYTGKWYIICDNLDSTLGEYKKLYGDKVIVFDKEVYAKKTDTMDNFHKMNIVVYARNATFDIAKDLGLDNFLVLDDDYIVFEYKKVVDKKLVGVPFKDLDKVFDLAYEYLNNTNFLTLSFAQGGDFIGGASNDLLKKNTKRKAMNSFFCKTDRPFQFIGTINEDTNAYTLGGTQGKLFLTIRDVSLTQTTTQQSNGGLTTIYLDEGTYVKSFYTVICAPSCASVRLMGNSHMRIHHHITWDNCTPYILDEALKKT